jgi:tryptophan synthase alpha chain
MTYYNPILRAGEQAFCRAAAEAGYAGLIVPDLPLEEGEELRRAAAEEGLAWVPLVAPTSPPQRVEALCRAATGFVYAVSTLGVTGERAELSARAAAVVAAVRAVTDLPVLVGLGVSTPEQAVQACAAADGVVVGSAVVRALTEGGVAAAQALVAELRAALDGAFAPA